eukprot:TRINITY_DN1293_c0_g1_i1.p1 TRINITY_DN1293_c0_g1~~TRINITY_DN1293_c0_g1_i1.p1  ORF type:complete len:960 (+),score=170.76 TRINITY_DN1293_c0_g1_i1:395-2881(+)
MAEAFCYAEEHGEFTEFEEGAWTGIKFVIEAQHYLASNPMPRGVEAACLRASTHYWTLFDHFRRELSNRLRGLQGKNVVADWKETKSWRLLRQITKSVQHHVLACKPFYPRELQDGVGLPTRKISGLQKCIDGFVTQMSDLLQLERDVELEATQDELNAMPIPLRNNDSSKQIDFLVNHGQLEHEQCDTLCNLHATRFSKGLGGLHLVTFMVENGHKLPPTTISPGEMVCVRTSDKKGASVASCMQGFVHSLGEDASSITIALECYYGKPTFSKLFGKSVRLDRIHGLADSVTYERNCEALMLLQKQGLKRSNPSFSVVATLFGAGQEFSNTLEKYKFLDKEGKHKDSDIRDFFDDSQKKAIDLGLDRNRKVFVLQGPPGTGKSSVLCEIVRIAAARGERTLVTAPSNAAVDNMVEKLATTGLEIVRFGNPVNMSPAVVSKSLGSIVQHRLADFQKDVSRKRADLRNDLRQCLKDDSLARGIRQLLKQLGLSSRAKEKETVRHVLSTARVVLCTNSGAADPLIRQLNAFDLLVIDEANQAIEPSCWIPILHSKRIILAGDSCQLAPVILSRKALEGGLGVSLLERATKLYSGALSYMLSIQYRMNGAIASWASKEMYGGALHCSPTVASHILVDSLFVKSTWMTLCPLLLLDTRMTYGSLLLSCKEHLDPSGTGSLYNLGEADIVVQHVRSLICAGVLPMNIAVQSPYFAQVQLLRERLAEIPETATVEVASIDCFQGREADAIIISMVRSNTLGAVGFLGDSRHINVAVTRARKHLAVVCDSSTICHNTFLARLLKHIRKYGKVRHARPGLMDDSGFCTVPLLPSTA